MKLVAETNVIDKCRLDRLLDNVFILDTSTKVSDEPLTENFEILTTSRGSECSDWHIN